MKTKPVRNPPYFVDEVAVVKGGILHLQPDVPLVTVTGEAVEVQTAEFFGTGRSDVEVVPMEAPFDTRKAEVAVVDAIQFPE